MTSCLLPLLRVRATLTTAPPLASARFPHSPLGMPRPSAVLALAAVLVWSLALTGGAYGQDRKSSRKARPAAGAAKPAPKADALPELISTEGEAPEWRNQKELEAAAAKGDPQACLVLGQQLLDATPPDPVRARPLFEKAAAAGVREAFFRLGKIHHDGLGVPVDRAKAFQYYLEAAQRGVPEAQYNVGAQLASGRGVRRNYIEGLAWLIVATRSGAAGDGEQQLRERLKGRLADIAAGEKRAAAIQAALAKGEPVVASGTGPAAAADSSSGSRGGNRAPLPEPPKVDRPTFQPQKPTAPVIEVPVAPLPEPLPGKP